MPSKQSTNRWRRDVLPTLIPLVVMFLTGIFFFHQLTLIIGSGPAADQVRVSSRPFSIHTDKDSVSGTFTQAGWNEIQTEADHE